MISLLYSCKGCGLDKAKAFVRYRRPDEDILSWMEEVKQAVADAHSLASMGQCNYNCCDLMIPLTSESGIGYPPDDR